VEALQDGACGYSMQQKTDERVVRLFTKYVGAEGRSIEQLRFELMGPIGTHQVQFRRARKATNATLRRASDHFVMVAEVIRKAVGLGAAAGITPQSAGVLLLYNTCS
jgi:hypothetical protein